MKDDNYPCVCKFQHTVHDLLTELNNTHQISAGTCILDKHKQYWLYIYIYHYALVEASFDAL